MQKTILLLSKDVALQTTRAMILERAGYRTASYATFHDALAAASRSDMAIIGHTFSEEEQDEFVERATETNSGLFIICLRTALVQPTTLIRACDGGFQSHPGAKVIILEETNVIPWPKRERYP